MLREIEEWYKNYSSSNAFYEDLSNIIDYKDHEITIEYSNLNNYYNEKETKIKIYFNKDRYSNLNVLNLYNKINKETITRNKIEYIST